ncbi:alpha/beta hydrolase [Luteolibacter sp. SL250]|uniref:alpha/beta fold hydrolase n=1 Tax=Luteolibacter sp. SL250 TaxID=2995170 RepID=UPI00226D9413|nr:alpha/beta hydrolase [Luteolibacter sp. SL250]WAC17801.1 alpha/beta hydrolase [Luteolibacter sp. SL250]
MNRGTLFRWALVGATAMAIALALISCTQSRFIYFPRPYGAGVVGDWRKSTGGRQIDFETSQGSQRAFLQGNLTSPRNLWIFCGGNGTIALDWSQWLQEHAPQEDAWLLIDYPGYGDCKGAPSPGRIRDSIKTAVPLAAKELGWPTVPDPARLRFFGHSLGAAAALVGASEFGIQRGVLLTPFTSTMDMSKAMTGLPIGFLIWHRFDNTARLKELAERGPGEVVIFHGTTDEAIPVEMSRQLAAERKDVVKFIEIPNGRHNTLQDTNPEEIVRALEEIGR